MNWLAKINAALDYLEENMAGTIHYETAAQRACCSAYQFQRLISFIADVPLAEYIRRRRLTLAAFDLQKGGQKVVDVALKYGYESPEAFARAFQNLHGVTPSMARAGGVRLRAYPRIAFQVTIRGDVEMDYRVEKKASFTLSGTARDFEMADGSCYCEIPEFWRDMRAQGEFERMAALAGAVCESGAAYPVQAVSWNPFGEGTRFRYMLGVAAAGEALAAAGYASLEIPAGMWAIFTSPARPCEEIAPVLQELNRRIYGEWLPTSNYELLDWQRELYYMNAQNEVFCEIWAMVQPKKERE